MMYSYYYNKYASHRLENMLTPCSVKSLTKFIYIL